MEKQVITLEDRTITIEDNEHHAGLIKVMVMFEGHGFGKNNFKSAAEALSWAHTLIEPRVPTWAEVTDNGRFGCD